MLSSTGFMDLKNILLFHMCRVTPESTHQVKTSFNHIDLRDHGHKIFACVVGRLLLFLFIFKNLAFTLIMSLFLAVEALSLLPFLGLILGLLALLASLGLLSLSLFNHMHF